MASSELRQEHINLLKVAEQQFRLACAVHLAVTNGVQSLDVPIEWTFGRHRVSHSEFALRQDPAEYSAAALEHTTTLVIASTIRDALVNCIQNVKTNSDANVVTAYQIARMIRNAFSHQMMAPRWSIDKDCKDRKFEIINVISLDTQNLNEKIFDWRDYGGSLAIFRVIAHPAVIGPVDARDWRPPGFIFG